MKLLYEAQNSVEAHMIVNLLEQAGLNARIDGEYLQGGIGEIQTFGLVRIMIEGSDYPSAKAIIDDWEQNQPSTEPSKNKPSNSLSIAIICFFLGILFTYIYYNTPITTDGIDHNDDGLLDEKWTYKNYLLSKVEIDSNLDGEMDLIYFYDQLGLIESSTSDQNFDGTFETEIYYDYGQGIWQKSDSNNDGFNDYRIEFKYGLPKFTRFYDAESNKPIKQNEYDSFKLIKTQLDSNRDGAFDTVREYNDIEEISKTYSIPSPQP